jgi:hypothetical protein
MLSINARHTTCFGALLARNLGQTAVRRGSRHAGREFRAAIDNRAISGRITAVHESRFLLETNAGATGYSSFHTHWYGSRH